MTYLMIPNSRTRRAKIQAERYDEWLTKQPHRHYTELLELAAMYGKEAYLRTQQCARYAAYAGLDSFAGVPATIHLNSPTARLHSVAAWHRHNYRWLTWSSGGMIDNHDHRNHVLNLCF